MKPLLILSIAIQILLAPTLLWAQPLLQPQAVQSNEVQSASEPTLRVYPLNHTEPAAVLATARDLFGDEISLAISEQGLVARGTPAQLEAIAKLVRELDRAPQRLRISLSDAPFSSNNSFGSNNSANTQRYSTAEQRQWSLNAGETLHLARGTTRQQPVFQEHWVAVETVPDALESITLRTRLTGGNTVRVDIEIHRESNGRFETLTQQLSGELGEWLSLSAESTTQSDSVKRYATRQSTLPAAIRIDKAPGGS